MKLPRARDDTEHGRETREMGIITENKINEFEKEKRNFRKLEVRSGI